MKKFSRFLLFVLTIGTLLLSACGATPATPNVGSSKVEAAPVAFLGLVDSIAGDQWVINDQTITVDPAVIRDGPFNAGDQVKVEGVVNADGSFTVSRVEPPTPLDVSSLPQFGNDNSNSLNGNDNSVNDANVNTNINDDNSNADNSNDTNVNDDNGTDVNSNGDNSNATNTNDANINDDNGNGSNSNDDNGSSVNSNSNTNDDQSGSGGNDNNGGGGNDNGGGNDGSGGGNKNADGGDD